MSKDKSGQGIDALLLAEASLRVEESPSSSRLLKDLLRSEMNAEENDAWYDDDDNDVRGSTSRSMRRLSSFGDDASDDDEDDMLQALENNGALKNGDAVRLILAKDRRMKNDILRDERPVGIMLWATYPPTELRPDGDMAVDSLPPLLFSEEDIRQNSVLALLKSSVSQAGM